MFEDREYPEKTWSLSKQRIFEECRRKYYYKTFMGWNGWKRNAPEDVRKAYLLGKLQNVYTLTGQAIHEEIRDAIISRSFSLEDSFLRIRKLLRRGWIESSDNLEEWKEQPKKYLMLSEIYYDKKEWLRKKSGEILERVRTALGNFERSAPYRSVLEDRAEIMEVDEDFPSFDHDGVRIFSVVDFLYRDLSEKTVMIVDWKTGTPAPGDAFQLRLYAHYVLGRYRDVKPGEIKCVDEYLLTGEAPEYIFGADEIGEIGNYISGRLKELDGYLEDAELNKPMDISHFPVNRGNRCVFCEFRELCFAHTPEEGGRM